MPRSLLARPIEETIYVVRGLRVIFDFDIAALYGVPVKRLKEQVRRNLRRFPPDFMIELTEAEEKNLRSQFASSSTWGGKRYVSFAFTEQGVAMLSSVLRSDRAIGVNIEIMRAFVRLRQLVASNTELQQKLNEMERRYDAQFQTVFEALTQLLSDPDQPHRRIGY